MYTSCHCCQQPTRRPADAKRLPRNHDSFVPCRQGFPGRRTRGKAGHHTEWWDRPRHRYELVTSEVVLVEAGSGDTSVAGQQLLAMQGIRVLADSPEVDFIATELIRRRLLPSKARLDAVHIAFAAVYQVDFLATWNCRHLANTNIRSAIKALFDELDKHVPVVCTLTELMELRHDH